MSLDVGAAANAPVTEGLDGHDEARALVRLLQCSLCSLLLRNPVTLPCGNSVCRQCLPPSHLRDGVTYPPMPNGHYGITCPFPECDKDHPVEDCSNNVILSKIMDSLATHLVNHRSKSSKKEIFMEEVLQLPPPQSDAAEFGPEKGHSHTASGGRLNATFEFVQAGALHYSSDINYQLESESFEHDGANEDNLLLCPIKESARRELDCHVCYNLMLDPTTTPCGHTFCRKCLARILDHSSFCPVCRRRLFLPASLTTQASNRYLCEILKSFWPISTAARAEAMLVEERSAPGGLDTPLFVCTLSFPGLRTILHVFEPRYRLMIRRAIETNGRFGMVLHNKHLELQGTMGRTQFLQYGTMLQIIRFQLTADGRSFLECRGLYRFKVKAHGILDGYIISHIDKEEDIALAEEEALEQHETSGVAIAEQDLSNDQSQHLDKLSTSQLLAIGTQFVQRNREPTARWFSTRLIETYGEPPEDAATFPYWLAAVLPLMEEEKYKIITMNSARERLKLTARWIQRIEAQRWYHGTACTVL